MTTRRFSRDADGFESFHKDRNSIEDFTRDWSATLGADTIATSVWTVVSGTVIIDSSVSNTYAATVWLSGDGGDYSEVQNRITTAGGRQYDWTMRIYGVDA